MSSSSLATLRVFTADGCPHCAALVDDFRKRKVRFEEVNLSRQPEQLENLQKLIWDRRLPVVVDHERVSIGFAGRASTFEELGIED